MTTQTEQKQGVTPKKQKGFVRRHLFLWFFLVVQVIFIAWLIVGITGNASALHTTAGQVGTTIGAGLVFGLWVGVDVILGVGRLIVVTSRRHKEG